MKRRARKPHPLYPEPGAWVLSKTRGMPELDPPKPITQDTKLEAQEIRDQYVAYEGLGYCVYEYVPTGLIADKQLARLWQTARVALQEIVEYLETVPTLSQKRKPLKRSKKSVKRVKGVALDIGQSAEDVDF